MSEPRRLSIFEAIGALQNRPFLRLLEQAEKQQRAIEAMMRPFETAERTSRMLARLSILGPTQSTTPVPSGPPEPAGDLKGRLAFRAWQSSRTRMEALREFNRQAAAAGLATYPEDENGADTFRTFVRDRFPEAKRMRPGRPPKIRRKQGRN